MIAKFFRSRSEQTTNVILVKYPNSGFADNALKGLGEYLALLPFVVLVVMFILLPLGLIIFNAFYNEYGEFGFGNFSKIFNSEFYLQALVLSLKISLYSSLIGIIIGFQGAYSLYAIKDSALGQESAALLGASTRQYFFKVGLPVLSPAILGTFIILFANALGAYATAYALTSGSFNILPIRIAAMIAGNLTLEPNMAAALALILVGLMLIITFVHQYLLSRYKID